MSPLRKSDGDHCFHRRVDRHPKGPPAFGTLGKASARSSTALSVTTQTRSFPGHTLSPPAATGSSFDRFRLLGRRSRLPRLKSPGSSAPVGPAASDSCAQFRRDTLVLAKSKFLSVSAILFLTFRIRRRSKGTMTARSRATEASGPAFCLARKHSHLNWGNLVLLFAQ